MSRVDRAVRNGNIDFVISMDDFCFGLINDVRDSIDRDELISISLDLILSILGGNDELSMETGSIVDSGIMIFGIL